MLCRICRTTFNILLVGVSEAEHPREASASHQPDLTALQKSAGEGCAFCAILAPLLKPSPEAATFSQEDERVARSSGEVVLVAYIDLADKELARVRRVWRTLSVRTHHSHISGNHPEFKILQTAGCHTALPGRKIAHRANLSLARSWIQECSSGHTNCTSVSKRELPTRLIYVGNRESDFQIVGTAGKCGLYAALSHCWGNSKVTGLRSETTAFSRAIIRWADLPRTFQDAVRVVQGLNLGIEYLWIDSFCILQGDETDFQRECARMHTTFANAAVTICGPQAYNADQGFLHERVCQAGPASRCLFTITVDGMASSITLVEISESEKTARFWRNSHLATRAWITQERLLSPRLLCFGADQMSMQCPSGDRFEDCCVSLQPGYLSKPSITSQDKPALYRAWYRIVQEYSDCNLTNGDDKLPALSGTARRFAQFLDSVYCAGLWENDMLRGLSWLRIPDNPLDHGKALARRRSRYPATVPAPSWSWASCDHQVQFDYTECDFRALATVLSVRMVATGSDACGQVKSGQLTILTHGRGAMLRTRVHQQFPASKHGEPSWQVVSLDDGAAGPTRQRPIGQLVMDDAYFHTSAYHPTAATSDLPVILALLGAHCQRGSDEPEEWTALVLIEMSDDSYRRIGMLLCATPETTEDGSQPGGWRWFTSHEMLTLQIS
jgi:hypothetical protein